MRKRQPDPETLSPGMRALKEKYAERHAREIERARKKRERARRKKLAAERKAAEAAEAEYRAHRDVWTDLKLEQWRVRAAEQEAERAAREAEARERERYDADRAYGQNRQQAAQERIAASMSRRLGHAVPVEYAAFPERAVNDFDPRRW
jgi:septal ring factor EnvC (AmiA/AmiB activator)